MDKETVRSAEIQANTSVKAPAKTFPRSAIALFVALTVIGIGCWIYQMVMGHQVTGMSDTSFWGSGIILFMLFVGLSAGGLIVASSAHVFNIESFKKVSLPAVIISTVSICMAAGFILVDVGGIHRIWRMLASPNLVSPLFWDMTVIALYLIINILDIMWITKGEEGKVRTLSFVALPVAILVHSVTAWIFSLQIGHMWYTAIMAPIFVVSALDSGMALLLLVLALLEARGLFSVDAKLFKTLSGLLAVFVAIDAYLIACEVLTMGYPGGADAAALSVMTVGATAPFFWFEIICGLIVPFVILAMTKTRENRFMVSIASLLIILGVLCKRIWLLLTGFIAPYAAETPTVADTLTANALSFGATGSFYCPSLIELLIMTGVTSLGVLAFMLLCNALLGKQSQK